MKQRRSYDRWRGVSHKKIVILVTPGQKRAALRSAVAEVKAALAQIQIRRASRRGERHREDLITSQLNEIYGLGGEESSLDREAALLQSRSIPRERS